MKLHAAIALSVVLGAAVVTTAFADEPTTLAPSPVAAAKYIVHVDGMT